MTPETQAVIEGLLSEAKKTLKLRGDHPSAATVNPDTSIASDLQSRKRNETKPFKQCKRGLKVMYSNADVLTASKMLELKERVKLDKPHIIAITEVKPKNSKMDRKDQDYTIANFSLHRWSRGRGINIWTHRSLDGAVSIPDFNETAAEAA